VAVKFKTTLLQSAPVCAKNHFQWMRDNVEAVIRRNACWRADPNNKNELAEVYEFREGITSLKLTWDTSDVISFEPYRSNPQENLLWRDDWGELRGILTYFPIDYPCGDKAGEFMAVVDPAYRRRGVATALLAEAVRRWQIDLTKQRYTREGAAFAKSFEARMKIGNK
jgi:GNAT superfamily N-acetyltransferase